MEECAVSDNNVKPIIDKETFDKIDIRVGTVERVDDIKESKKLVQLTVDFGGFKRQIISGMKTERENPGEITGKQALFVVNLEPRKIAGYRSEGMLFDIGSEDGIVPVLAQPEKLVPNGSRAG